MLTDRDGPRLPRLARFLIEAPLPPELRDAVVGDFAEELERRRGRSSRAPALWLWRQVLASLASWLRYWIARPCPARVVVAVSVGLLTVAAGLAFEATGPVPAVLGSLPPGWRYLTGWTMEAVVVVIAAYVASRVGRGDTFQVESGLAAPLIVLVYARYWMCAGTVGVPQLLLKSTVVVGGIVVGMRLASRRRRRRAPRDLPTRA